MAIAVNLKTDEADVYCGRPSIWGNPSKSGNHVDDVENYRKYLWQRLNIDKTFLNEFTYLAALDRKLSGNLRLGCYCKPEPCHCDVLVNALKWYNNGYEK